VADEERIVEGSVLVVGSGLRGLAAAKDMETLGYSVVLVSGPELDGAAGEQGSQCRERRAELTKQLGEQGIHIRPWPQVLELNGSPGSYEVVLRYRSEVSHVKAGAVILDLGELEGEVPPTAEAFHRGNLLGRILAQKSCEDSLVGVDSLRGPAIKETAGIFVLSPDRVEIPEEQVIMGMAAAARASAYLGQGVLSPRASAVTIDNELCRGCGDCVAICPYIEMRVRDDGMACAYVDRALCLGCGACIARCPTGAIKQALQSGEHIISTLEYLLEKATNAVEVR
jgi:heterodisulfide reductase subunit A-like polyferredoxin